MVESRLLGLGVFRKGCSPNYAEVVLNAPDRAGLLQQAGGKRAVDDFATTWPGQQAVRNSTAAWLPGRLISLLASPALWAVSCPRAAWLRSSLILLLDSPGARAVWAF